MDSEENEELFIQIMMKCQIEGEKNFYVIPEQPHVYDSSKIGQSLRIPKDSINKKQWNCIKSIAEERALRTRWIKEPPSTQVWLEIYTPREEVK